VPTAHPAVYTATPRVLYFCHGLYHPVNLSAEDERDDIAERMWQLVAVWWDK